MDHLYEPAFDVNSEVFYFLLLILFRLEYVMIFLSQASASIRNELPYANPFIGGILRALTQSTYHDSEYLRLDPHIEDKIRHTHQRILKSRDDPLSDLNRLAQDLTNTFSFSTETLTMVVDHPVSITLTTQLTNDTKRTAIQMTIRFFIEMIDLLSTASGLQLSAEIYVPRSNLSYRHYFNDLIRILDPSSTSIDQTTFEHLPINHRLYRIPFLSSDKFHIWNSYLPHLKSINVGNLFDQSSTQVYPLIDSYPNSFTVHSGYSITLPSIGMTSMITSLHFKVNGHELPLYVRGNLSHGIRDPLTQNRLTQFCIGLTRLPNEVKDRIVKFYLQGIDFKTDSPSTPEPRLTRSLGNSGHWRKINIFPVYPPDYHSVICREGYFTVFLIIITENSSSHIIDKIHDTVAKGTYSFDHPFSNVHKHPHSDALNTSSKVLAASFRRRNRTRDITFENTTEQLAQVMASLENQFKEV